METLKEIKEYFDTLNTLANEKEKNEFKVKYLDNETIKSYLEYIYSPYKFNGINYNQLVKPLGETIINKYKTQYEAEIASLEHKVFKYSNFTEKEIKELKLADFDFKLLDVLNLYCSNLDKDRQEALAAMQVLRKLVYNILGTDYADFILKIFGRNFDQDLDTTFEVKAQQPIESKESLLKDKEFILTQRVQGVRCIALKYNDTVEMFDLNGQKITGIDYILKEFKENFPNDVCLDGILTDIDYRLADEQYYYGEALRKVSGRTSEFKKTGVKDFLVFVVNDCMTAHEFLEQETKLTFEERRFDLDNYIKSADRGFISKLPILYQGADKSEIRKNMIKLLSEYKSGLRINIKDGLYKFGGDDSVLIFEVLKEIEGTVIEIIEGTGNRQRNLGSMKFKLNSGEDLKIADGYFPGQDWHIWVFKEEYLNNTGIIQYVNPRLFSKNDMKLSELCPHFIELIC